ARAMNWADSLAGSTGLAVHLGVADGGAVRLVHHVFRPDGSPQRIRTGEEQPLHATALGKCLLAFAPIATPPARDLDLQPWTGRTCVTVAALEAHLALARRRGWATDTGEYESGVGGAAAPLRASGGIVVAALGVVGPVEDLYGLGGELRPWLAEQLVAAAREISAALVAGPCRTLGRGEATRHERARRRRHRPGHHLHPVPAVQPGRADARRGPARAPPALPEAGARRARRGGDLAQR